MIDIPPEVETVFKEYEKPCKSMQYLIYMWCPLTALLFLFASYTSLGRADKVKTRTMILQWGIIVSDNQYCGANRTQHFKLTHPVSWGITDITRRSLPYGPPALQSVSRIYKSM
jgi:hypothetical protein